MIKETDFLVVSQTKTSLVPQDHLQHFNLPPRYSPASV